MDRTQGKTESSDQRSSVIQHNVTKRSIIIGALLIPLSCYWVSNSEMVTEVTELTAASLIIGSVFILFIIIFLNFLLKKLVPPYTLSSSEMLVIYVMLNLAMSINGIGMFGFLTPSLCNPFWFASPENSWSDFYPYIPEWFAPRDMKALENFYEGGSTLYNTRHLKAWLPSIITWSSFTFVLLFMMMCLNVIMRKIWIETERLSFPIAAIPIQMTLAEKNIRAFFKNKVLWIGFSLSAIIESVNSIHYLYPVFPHIQIRFFDIGYLFVEKPWSAIAQGGFALSFYPTVIALTYFLPLEISFSCWFFYLSRKALRMTAVLIGMGSGILIFTEEQNISEQGLAITELGTSAWIGITIASVWKGRRHIAQVLRSALRNKNNVSDIEEPMSYKTAVWGLLVGMIFLMVFSFMAGMSLYVSFIFFLIFFIYMLALTRIRAGSGTAWIFGPGINPPDLTTRILGTRVLGPNNLTILAYFQWFNLDFRAISMPHQLEGFKIAQKGNIKRRQFAVVMILATVLGIIFSYWAVLDMYYKNGADTPASNGWRTHMGNIPYFVLRLWFDRPSSTDKGTLIGLGSGFLVVFFLIFMNTRFLWWKLNPLGYAIAYTHSMYAFWFAMFISWFVKWMILRIGGLRLNQKAMPFFVGLLLGDYITACLWSLGGLAFGIPMYRVF